MITDFAFSYQQDCASKNQHPNTSTPYHQPKTVVQFVSYKVPVKKSNPTFVWLISKKSACNLFSFNIVQSNCPLSLLYTNAIEVGCCVLGDFCYCQNNLMLLRSASRHLPLFFLCYDSNAKSYVASLALLSLLL